ncbi:MAG TPA: hypothetical protein VM487_10725, partial [Phycisphaerae bacterium]|nr:hypothetical protein [Phycisphaerae bacterium]
MPQKTAGEPHLHRLETGATEDVRYGARALQDVRAGEVGHVAGQVERAELLFDRVHDRVRLDQLADLLDVGPEHPVIDQTRDLGADQVVSDSRAAAGSPTFVELERLGGRPRYYGVRLPTPEQIRQNDSVPWQTVRAYAAGRTHDFRIKTVGPLRWPAAGGTRDLRLIVIAPLGYRLTRAGKLLYRRPAYLICTDATLPLNQVLQAYLWRWDIEVNLRDEKTVLGVGQAQVRHVHAVQNVPATAVAAYALLLLAAAQAYGPAGQPDTLPLPAWRRRQPPARATTMRLINQLRRELWGQAIRDRGLEHFSARQRR